MVEPVAMAPMRRGVSLIEVEEVDAGVGEVLDERWDKNHINLLKRRGMGKRLTLVIRCIESGLS